MYLCSYPLCWDIDEAMESLSCAPKHYYFFCDSNILQHPFKEEQSQLLKQGRQPNARPFKVATNPIIQ